VKGTLFKLKINPGIFLNFGIVVLNPWFTDDLPDPISRFAFVPCGPDPILQFFPPG
jgi:hypothetical protein